MPKKEMDPRSALSKIIERLTSNATHKYYSWTCVGDPPVWFLRVPKESKEESALQKEGAHIIHICRPFKFLEAIEVGKKEELALFSAYVKEGACLRCQREVPTDVSKNLEIQVKLHKLSKSIS